MGCCVGENHSNWCEKYGIVYIDAEGKEYCIFHAPADCKFVELYDEREVGDKPALMDAEQFNGMVFERIDGVIAAGVDEERDKWDWPWNPRCNFAGTFFPYSFSFHEYDGQNDKYLPPINFNSSQFDADAYFNISLFNGYTDFSSVQFNKNAYFRSSQFRLETDFSSAQFSKNAFFNNSQFSREVYFSNSQFSADANFSNPQFSSDDSFSSAQFSDYADFSSTQFSADAFFSSAQFSADATFSSAQFSADAFFSSAQFSADASFSSAQFSADAFFSSAQFSADASFSSAQFSADAFFSSAQFSADASFSSAQFSADAYFENAEIQKQAKFTDVKFIKSDFDQMKFNGPVYFDNSIFKQETSFTNTIFHEYSNFEQTKFQGNADFHLAFFKEWSYFRKAHFGGETTFAGAISKETILLESVDLTNLKFAETNIESFKFIDCKWGDKRFEKIYDERHQTEDCTDTTLAEIYRRLKRIARESADEEQTSHWHYREKEMTRKSLADTPLLPLFRIATITATALALCGWILKTAQPSLINVCVSLLVLSATFYIVSHDQNNIENLNKVASKIYLNTYKFISGYGEDPVRAGVILLGLVLLPFIIKFLVSLWTTAPMDWLKEAMWYMPLIKITLNDSQGLHYLLKGLSVTLITLQAALFGFALRNKLRR